MIFHWHQWKWQTHFALLQEMLLLSLVSFCQSRAVLTLRSRAWRPSSLCHPAQNAALWLVYYSNMMVPRWQPLTSVTEALPPISVKWRSVVVTSVLFQLHSMNYTSMCNKKWIAFDEDYFIHFPGFQIENLPKSSASFSRFLSILPII